MQMFKDDQNFKSGSILSQTSGNFTDPDHDTNSSNSTYFLQIYPDWFISFLYLIIQVVNAVLFYRLITSDFLSNNKKETNRITKNDVNSEETERFVESQ